MKTYTTIVFVFIIALGSVACLRLDSNLFNPSEKEAYLYNDYVGGELYNIMPDSMHIADSMIHEIVLESNDNGDKADIYSVFVGDLDQIRTDTIILYCHGNAANMDNYWSRVELLANVGHKHKYGVMMMDYRGYGRSEGSPSESGLYADVSAVLSWLKANGLRNERLIMYGFSLGTAPATELTANPEILEPSMLILEAPFASAAKMQQDASVISLPTSFLTDLEIDNAEEIKKVNQPFLWMHGVKDDFIRIENGEVIVKNYQGAYKVERRVPEGEHSTVPIEMGVREYIQLMEGFISGSIQQ